LEPKSKREKRFRRHKRVRAKIFGTAKVPRLCVFRSAKRIYAQLIDDEKGMTLVSASDLELTRKSKSKRKAKVSRETDAKFTPLDTKLSNGARRKTDAKILTGKTAIAYEVGKLIAKKALAKNIEKVIFDRGGYKYHGRVKALAEGAREGGLVF